MSSVPGPEVGTGEELYRCITTMDWWVPEENRPSSAAFKQPDFSVDIASIAKTPAYTLSRFPPGCGLVVFKYADAKLIGYLARQEPDPEYPDNLAHANVYNPAASGNKRKTMAQELAQKIAAQGGVLKVPNFSVGHPP